MGYIFAISSQSSITLPMFKTEVVDLAVIQTHPLSIYITFIIIMDNAVN